MLNAVIIEDERPAMEILAGMLTDVTFVNIQARLTSGGGITGNDTALRRRDNRIPSAGTVAKFINNCSLLLLLLNGVTSDGTMAETCTTADC